ncbi:XRE family transcriptional regulator [Wenjunlia tyrosinilytica]|uniref:XRE family transcriptional regulator n=1 Tax=Wenjunlia tyrosinilytica TaxID=1544741 RepID=A0A917ZSU4_9ACTN|nr:XRE family transcriptional regulator [Wenjunlia tyrosinilytica]GGO90886.1 XRE family transcriptional regulator [Wenjunlia tyrosinilytica]
MSEGGAAGPVLAANLKALRAERSLSLSELARRSGIAKGTLSQLESGSGNPTIETVFSLSNALRIPVSSLLTERVLPDVVVVRSAGLDVLSSNAVDLRMLRRLDVASSVVEVYDQRVRPGQVQHSGGHPGLEHVVVVSGVLRVGPEGHTHELGPGDYVCFPAQGPHTYETVGGPVASVLILEYPADPDAPRAAAPCALDPHVDSP